MHVFEMRQKEAPPSILLVRFQNSLAQRSYFDRWLATRIERIAIRVDQSEANYDECERSLRLLEALLPIYIIIQRVKVYGLLVGIAIAAVGLTNQVLWLAGTIDRWVHSNQLVGGMILVASFGLVAFPVISLIRIIRLMTYWAELFIHAKALQGVCDQTPQTFHEDMERLVAQDPELFERRLKPFLKGLLEAVRRDVRRPS
jgi:hypothetical protein